MSLEADTVAVLVRLVDTDPCEEEPGDDTGYCHTHMSDAPCAHAEGANVLDRWQTNEPLNPVGFPPGVEAPGSDPSPASEALDLIAGLIDGEMCEYNARGDCLRHERPGANFECPHYRAAVFLGRMR